MALRLNATNVDDESADLFLPDSELAAMLRIVTKLAQTRLQSQDRVQAVLGTAAAELGVACSVLYRRWDEQGADSQR